MYFWKSWHDSRYHFLAMAVMATVFTGTFAATSMLRFAASPHGSNLAGHTYLVRTTDPVLQREIWSGLMAVVPGQLAMFAVLAALGLGTCFLANEYSCCTLEFLLTRPRHRCHFVWTSWGVGALELFAITVLALALCMALGFYSTHTVTSWRMLALIPTLVPLTFLVYGLTYFAGVLAKSARNGAAIAFGVMLIYMVTLTLFYSYWHIRVPDWWFSSLPGWVRSDSSHFPLLRTVGWTAVTLVFPFASQKLLERRDV